jgi:DNA-binding transcriptional ArsR family regulator
MHIRQDHSTRRNGVARSKRPELTVEGFELVASLFKVLSEPVRLRILRTLEDGEMTVNAITTRVESTQPNVSRHLKILQGAGLVRRRQRGSTVLCSIADPMVVELCDMVCGRIRERLRAQVGHLGLRKTG